MLSPIPSGVRGPQALSLPAQEDKPHQQKRKPSTEKAFPTAAALPGLKVPETKEERA